VSVAALATLRLLRSPLGQTGKSRSEQLKSAVTPLPAVPAAPEMNAEGLTVPERIMLFCVASRTDW